MLSCHCHVFVMCSSSVLYAARGKTTTKGTAPCKARKNDLFSLGPQEQETFPGRNEPIASGWLFTPCACSLLASIMGQKGNRARAFSWHRRGFGTAQMSTLLLHYICWASISHPAISNVLFMPYSATQLFWMHCSHSVCRCVYPVGINLATAIRKFVEGAAFPSKCTFVTLPETRVPV